VRIFSFSAGLLSFRFAESIFLAFMVLASSPSYRTFLGPKRQSSPEYLQNVHNFGAFACALGKKARKKAGHQIRRALFSLGF
jgi:hypothetical protein